MPNCSHVTATDVVRVPVLKKATASDPSASGLAQTCVSPDLRDAFSLTAQLVLIDRDQFAVAQQRHRLARHDAHVVAEHQRRREHRP